LNKLDHMEKRFLDQIPEGEYGVVEGFIVQVYRTISYFCSKCNKASEEICECGGFPEQVFQVEGVFSDGTKTMSFTTLSERVAEDLACIRKSDAGKVNPQELMNKPYRLLVYAGEGRLCIEEVLG
jgi:hypothetical protein